MEPQGFGREFDGSDAGARPDEAVSWVCPQSGLSILKIEMKTNPKNKHSIKPSGKSDEEFNIEAEVRVCCSCNCYELCRVSLCVNGFLYIFIPLNAAQVGSKQEACNRTGPHFPLHFPPSFICHCSAFFSFWFFGGWFSIFSVLRISTFFPGSFGNFDGIFPPFWSILIFFSLRVLCFSPPHLLAVFFIA